VVRTAGSPSQLVETVRRRMQELEPNRAMYDARPLTEFLFSSLAERRFQTGLLSLFGLTALSLAAVGLYGVTSFYVSQRSREIGLRSALGAQRAQLLGLVFRQAAMMTAAGLTAWPDRRGGIDPYMVTLLFGVPPVDPLTFLATPLVLGAVAAVAVWAPAWRATRVDPVVALRQE
jgi:ABC-type antimicrobial peptide transport system permease subunit